MITIQSSLRGTQHFSRPLLGFALLCMLTAPLAYGQRLPERERLKAAVNASMVVASSDDISAIPPHEVLHLIFLQVFMSPDFAAKFSEEDMEIINNLPSHDDVRFARHARNSLNSACGKINRIRGNQISAAIEIANEFELAKKSINSQLATHYGAVFESLSGQGKALVLDKVSILSQTDSISYSDLDFNKLSREVPEYSSDFIRNSCQKLSNSAALNHDREAYLRDSFANAVQNGTAIVHARATGN